MNRVEPDGRVPVGDLPPNTLFLADGGGLWLRTRFVSPSSPPAGEVACTALGVAYAGRWLPLTDLVRPVDVPALLAEVDDLRRRADLLDALIADALTAGELETYRRGVLAGLEEAARHLEGVGQAHNAPLQQLFTHIAASVRRAGR